jgi:hypothetical protein
MKMKGWFQVWNRPEYYEWAYPISGGYLLTALRVEQSAFLCARAKLLIGAAGLPAFELIEEKRYPKKSDAEKQIDAWKEDVDPYTALAR